jgi:16S rRNA (uracil1498-N3)-methyltransferase
LQKGTELGIVEFVPLISQRCVIASLDDVNKKKSRWQRIVREAAEQSRRGRLPNLQPAMFFSQACERAKRTGGLSLMPWEEEKRVNLKLVFGREEKKAKGKMAPSFPPRPFSINLFIGPEGGFAFEEVLLAQRYGIVPISLGPRILRAETAGLVAVAAILYELGDLG